MRLRFFVQRFVGLYAEVVGFARLELIGGVGVFIGGAEVLEAAVLRVGYVDVVAVSEVVFVPVEGDAGVAAAGVSFAAGAAGVSVELFAGTAPLMAMPLKSRSLPSLSTKRTRISCVQEQNASSSPATSIKETTLKIFFFIKRICCNGI